MEPKWETEDTGYLNEAEWAQLWAVVCNVYVDKQSWSKACECQGLVLISVRGDLKPWSTEICNMMPIHPDKTETEREHVMCYYKYYPTETGNWF